MSSLIYLIAFIHITSTPSILSHPFKCFYHVHVRFGNKRKVLEMTVGMKEYSTNIFVFDFPLFLFLVMIHFYLDKEFQIGEKTNVLTTFWEFEKRDTLLERL